MGESSGLVALRNTCSSSDDRSPLTSRYKLDESWVVVSFALEMEEMAVSLRVCGSGIDSRRAVRPREKALGGRR